MFESIVFAVFMVVFVTGVMTIITKMAKGHLKEWAAVNRLELLECEYRHVKIGPYHKKLFFVGKGHYLIFRIEAKTEEGATRKGWARVGGYFFGQLSGAGAVDVVWD